ncbi:alkaline phosphatase family protein [Pseudoalteromonas sp. CST5]|uniref:alkaline phosphatase family protein n=1 Tax=unclassified Pseudoalteromonas TaxID=194690 RepID=UPI002358D3E8|nr:MULTISPECIES: alkaline phosphatase family protein [unclassified Pseudoalteromonas]MDC9515043.1 alkaline phosphatase family protein [Pseudoalteromonas sp. CST1]MDC9539357.1 alkaline phosphatase family protein [Pseudoalteromonas sp. CST3]MDC9541741.1 alkaline phosphatase family protein [Pseudoalteromonas sp. CST2]MDC9546629.1 alkaline phosphatase family protein [Pseudoalteromonas sp. CST4]MDC9551069.1 alkaline phosphatase family protein [Pseudoalteromonas sp. CST5]
MNSIIKATVFSIIVLISNTASAAQNVVLVTLDGVRWQEVFSGADKNLINNADFVKNPTQLNKQFGAPTANERQQLLMPFLTQHVAKKGVIVGDRAKGSNMSVSNPWYFSYPGYNEILTGEVDEKINSNNKVLNANKTILERLDERADFKGKTALFGSWDVFPYIVNTQRSNVYVNAGFMPIENDLFADAKLLNALQNEIPSPWENVRLDSFTYRFAKAYMLAKTPRLLVTSLGETDDFAHDGHYDQYLKSARQSDAFLKDLWNTIQTTPGYKNNTTLIVTTDHGRGGSASDWQHHSSKRALAEQHLAGNKFPEGIVGSEHIWLAAIGPAIKGHGLIKTQNELKQAQVAATVLSALGINPKHLNSNMAPPISEILK